MLQAAGATVIGLAHSTEGMPNQDAMAVCGHLGGGFVAVADGLGSRPRSHVGSRLAVRLAKDLLARQTRPGEERNDIRTFYQAWLKGLHGLVPEQAATTLLSASCTRDGHCQIWQLGDGLVLFRSEGKFGTLDAKRGGFCNETEALGITRSFAAWKGTRVRITLPGDGVMLLTDGLADDLKPEQLELFFDYMRKAVCRRSRRSAKIWLRTQINVWPTARHADDKTIALIFLNTP